MVKIVGVDLKKVKLVTCPNCASILEYTPNEVIHDKYTDYSGCSKAYNFINCPSCGAAAFINVEVR